MNQEDETRCEIGQRLWDIFEEKCKLDEDIADAYMDYIIHVQCCHICF